ncbi:alpha-protein kinase 3 isoform X2 [Esox lucius]|uniref:non-specific serine/threonine protein kinase n=1 Tax=Esox lucius TaxID=8010 RepID=A0A3P8XFS3_ESOLU|nr:alpha-protein kinase 3 isoform X2 [Esox lucius]
MSSRRLTTRSYSAGDGRSGYHNVDDVTGSSRANSRANSHSYLSSVRPEHRSTLHCVMQQLTEETQPYFESTLKSKAVSETCNTMFTCDVSGHPTPEVTWYKDDVQLDRYCGLPKYNISRNGQNHSLHIYNCSEEDAAIYQASARNSKGIVSCSGVLEVGTMTEYKIHQQYFAKMKLNAEKNSRELEKPKVWDKENHISLDGQQETQRTISPDRSQRKRHSPMDHSFIAPSSMENEVVEKNTLAQAAEVESRIQDRVAGEEEMETTVIGTGASYIKRQTAITENGSSKGLTYDHDSLQKYFAPHTPKVSLSKKKVKIFKGEESSVTADSQAGKGPERDSGMSEEGKVSVTFCLADSATLPIEAMEVESAVDPSASKMNGVNYMKQTKKDPQNNTVSIMEDVKVQLDEKTLVKTLPHKDESTSPGFSSKGQTTSGTKNQTCSVAQVTRKVGNNNIKGSHSTVPPVTSIQPQAHTSDKLQPKPIIPVELQPQPSLAVELQPQPSTSVTLQPQPSASLKLQPQPRPPSVTSQPQQSEIVKPPVQTSLSVKPPEQTSLSVKPPTQPSLSVKPQAQPSLSVKPQAQPSLLVKPRAQPSLSVKPSAHPSLLVKPQAQPSLIVKPQAQPSHPVKLQAQPILSTKPEAQPSLSLNPETQPSHHSAKLQPQPNKRSPLSGELVPQLCQSSGPSAKRNPSPSANLHSQSSPSQTQQPQTSPSVTLQPQPSSCPHMSNSSSKGIGTNQNIIMDNKPSAPGNLNSFTAKAKTECSSKDSATVLGILQSDTSSIHQTGRAGHVAGGTVPSVLMIPRESSKSVSALPQRLCEQAGDQMSEEETSTSLKNVSVSQLPVLLGEEVTQKHRQKIERNGTPVCPESVTPTTRSKLNMPRKHSPSASDEELVTDANKRTPAVHNTPGQSASDKLTQGTQEYSRGSNESNTVPFTEPLMSPLESHGAGENTLGCSVSLVGQRCQIEMAIKKIGETEIQVDLKGKGSLVGELQVKRDNNEKKPGLESVHKAERVSKFQESEIKTISKTPVMESVERVKVQLLDVELENKQCGLKKAECKIPDIQKCLPQNCSLNPCFSTFISNKTNSTDKTNVSDADISRHKKIYLKDAPKPVAKVMSIAELLRSQMVCIDDNKVPLVSVAPIAEISISTPPVQNPNADQQPRSPSVTGIQNMRMQSLELRMYDTNYRQEPEKSTCKKVAGICNGFVSASNVEHNLTSSKPECVESSIVRPMTEASSKAFVIPPISIIDMDGSLENSNTPLCIVTNTENVMDAKHEQVLDHTAYISPDGNYNGQRETSLITPEQRSSEMTVTSTPISSVTDTAETQQKLSNSIKEMNSSHALPPVFSSQHGRDRRCPSSLSEHSEESSPLPNTKKPGFTTNPSTPTLQPVHEPPPVIGMNLIHSEEHKPDAPQTDPQPVTMLVTRGFLCNETQGSVPVSIIHLDNKTSPSEGVKAEEYSKSDSLSCVTVNEVSTGLLKTDSVSLIPSATPQELASGARRKIIIPKVQGEDPKAAASPTDVQSPHREEVSRITFGLSPESPSPKSPCQSLRFPLRQNQSGQHTPPAERQSPLLVRRKVTQNPETTDTAKTEEKPSEQDKHKHNPFKAPQVIRKIRGEPFSDAAGHLKLWCQFFNVLSDSTIRWFRDEVEIATDKRSSGDETQVALAIVHTSSIDCGVYGCTITNEYGTDTTDFLLSVDILSGMFLRDDQEVGEEIEMTPLLFTKGLADSGTWGRKFFGRIMTEEAHIGKGCSHKACKVKVIYGLDPVFESGSTCYIKVKSPIAYYGAKGESNLVERNHAMTQQECRIQNMAREYSKIFAAECRVIETFGAVLEVIPVYLIYRPANTIPHATVETDLNGDFVRYSQVDASGRLVMGTGSEAALKCSALQHWIHQWTNGNLLLTRMEGVDLKITNVSVSIKSKGYQSLTITENPSVFEQFVSQHHCNYYCGLLSLKLLKSQDSLQTPAKPKGSRSPLLHRKVSGSSSPQPSRKATGSPRLARKEVEPEDSKSTTNLKNVDFLKVVQS